MADGQIGIRVIPDAQKFRADLKKVLDRAERTMRLKLDLDLGRAEKTLTAFRSKLAGAHESLNLDVDTGRAKDKLDKLTQGFSATINADADTGMARTKLAALTRPRTVNIAAKLSTTSLTKVRTALAALSGARLIGDHVKRLGTNLSNLDRSLPKIAAVSLGVGAIGAAGLASVQGLVSLGAGLAAVSGAALALPGLMAGAAAGVATLSMALADAKKQLGGLGPLFTKLQDSVSTSFWEKAKAPIEDMVRTVLPSFKTGMTAVSGELGKLTSRISTDLKSSLNSSVVAGMFEHLRASIATAQAGFSGFLKGFITLGEVGSKYLQPLAGWFSALGTSFNAWIQTNKANGNLFAWIDAGIAGLKSLGSIVGSVGSVLAGLFKAAQGAGSTNGLTVLAENLRKVADIVNGAGFQKALTTVFQGAGEAMRGMGKALAPIGEMFQKLAPTIAKVMGTVGDTVGTLLGNIAKALQSPAFATGLTSFFTGLQTGLAAIGPALPALASAFGTVASFAGALAAQLGPVLGTAIKVLAPVVTQLLTAIQPLIPVLGQALITALTALGPLFAAIPPIMEALAPLVSQLIEAFVPLLTSVLPVLQPLLQALPGLFQAIMPAITSVITAITPLVTLLAETLTPVIEALMPVVKTVFEAISTIISSVMKIVQGVIKTVTSLIKGDWKGVWEGIKQILSGVWGVIKSVVTGAINVVKSVIQNIGGRIAEIWNGLWKNIGSLLSGAWSGITKAVGDGIGKIVDWFKGLWGRITGAIGDLGSKMVGIGTDMIRGFLNGIGNMAGQIKKKVEDVIGGAIGWAKGILGIHSPSRVFKQIGNFLGVGFANGITGTAKQVQAATGKMVNLVKDAFDKREDLVKKANTKIASLESKLAATQTKKTSQSLKNAQRRQVQAQARLSKAQKAAAKNPKSKTAKKELENAKKAVSNAKYALTSAKEQLAASNAKVKARQKDLKAQLKAAKADKKSLQSVDPRVEKQLLAKLTVGTKQLEAIAVKREVVATKLKDARKALTDLQKQKSDYEGNVFSSLMGLGDPTKMRASADAIIAGMTKARDKILKFGQQIRQLKNLGLNADTIDQIVSAGAEQGAATAEALLKGGTSAINQVNSLQTQMTSASKSVASTAGDALYGAGVQAAQGLVKGLQSQEKALIEQATKIANSMAAAVKKALKIHSPSRVFRDEVGVMIARGIIAGTDKEAPALDRAMSALVSVPGVGDSSPSSLGAPRVRSATAIHLHTNDPYQGAKEMARLMNLGAQ